MDPSQNLRQLLLEQQEQGQKLEAAIHQLEQADTLQENSRLRERSQALEEEAAHHRQTSQQLADENRNLRERLMEQMYRQRDTLLSDARRQADLLFQREEQTAVNALAAQNTQIRARLDTLRAELALLAGQGPEIEALRARVAEAEELSRQYMRHYSGAIQEQFQRERAEAARAFDALQEQPLSPEQVSRKLQSNSMELKIGGRITVIVGVFFILLSVVFGLRYTYLLAESNVLKGLIAYSMGAVFLGFAEFMRRKGWTIFSTGICAGGVAILFASTAVSYFTLGILSIPLAVVLCFAIAALSLFQALRYNAQVIAVFALIGGYLPMTAVNETPVMILSAMGYFLVLSLFVLLVALGKRWQTLKYFSFGASAAGTIYLLGMVRFGMVPGVIYTAANFLLYMAIILIYPLLRRAVLRKSDTVLMGLCTAFTCGQLFYLLERNGYGRAGGAMALGFCLLFFLFARWLKVALAEDAGSRGLFYATSFAFWALAVPLQFDSELISMGWLIEGVALGVYGILTDRKWYRRAGFAISGLCLGSFLLFDATWLLLFWGDDSLFLWRYGGITLGALVLLGAALYKGYGNAGMAVLRCGALINLWLYSLCLVYVQSHLFPLAWEDYLALGLAALLTLGFGVLYRTVPLLRQGAMDAIAVILQCQGLILALAFGTQRLPLSTNLLWGLGLVVLMAFVLAAVLALFRLLRSFSGLSPEWAGLWTAIYALIAVNQLIMVQWELNFRSMAVSFVVIVWAFAAIIFGFVRRYSYLRRFGLGLSLLSISKLFLADLSFLPSGQRILSYFVFGVIFIAISYVYQLFSRKLFPAELSPHRPDPPPEDTPPTPE